jgi:alkylhydroperoxidase family enzyme
MENRAGRYAALTKRLVDSVLATSGHLASDARQAVLARAARLGGRPASPLPQRERRTGGEDIPPALADYVDKVALHAYTVTDEDLATLQRAGNSDDVLFEATVSAALGAALGRLERGLSALRGDASPPDPLSTTSSSPPVPLSAARRGGTQE